MNFLGPLFTQNTIIHYHMNAHEDLRIDAGHSLGEKHFRNLRTHTKILVDLCTIFFLFKETHTIIHMKHITKFFYNSKCVSVAHALSDVAGQAYAKVSPYVTLIKCFQPSRWLRLLSVEGHRVSKDVFSGQITKTAFYLPTPAL